MKGKLYIVPTPVGNLEDMTYRAVRILKEADIIAAEDTRNSIKLLNHFEISTPMTSYHEFNKYDKADYLIGRLSDGQNIALITDAGTPGISDPGEVLVEKCFNAGITVVPVPGACAAVNALIASGQPTRRFAFEAFLPADKKERKAVLESLKDETRTIIVYEAPHRLVKTLKELMENLGDRSLTLCKELTKKHESFIKTTFAEALLMYENEEPRGEFVLVIRGKSAEEILQDKAAAWENISVTEQVSRYEAEGMTRKEAIKKTAEERGVPKREVYAEVVGNQDK
jgi:16S rRNA (cytidine1402-2'-O)-methyltransferase